MRLGLVALASWEQALRRVAIVFAGALLAIACGAAMTWWKGFAHPGEVWLAVLAAPALALGGLLSGRRPLVVLRALLVLALGAAQANGQVWLPLQGSVE